PCGTVTATWDGGCVTTARFLAIWRETCRRCCCGLEVTLRHIVRNTPFIERVKARLGRARLIKLQSMILRDWLSYCAQGSPRMSSRHQRRRLTCHIRADS